MSKEPDGFQLWQAFSDAGLILDPLPAIPGSSTREVHVGNGVGLPAWGVRQGPNGPEFVALEQS